MCPTTKCIIGLKSGPMAIADLGEIVDIVAEAKSQDSIASLIRVYAVQVPLPKFPLVVVGIYPNTGKEDSQEVGAWNKEFLQTLMENDLDVLTFGTDGASEEIGGVNVVIHDRSLFTNQEEVFSVSGHVHFSCPIKRNGKPFLRFPDPKHLLKTSRNAIFSGARMMIMGNGYPSLLSLIDIVENRAHGKTDLRRNDVFSVDKQDDRAAFRSFQSGTIEDAIERGHLCTGVFLYVVGQLVDSAANRTMPHATRVRLAMGTYFFCKIGNSMYFQWVPLSAST